MGTKEDLHYLEEERKKLWEEVTALKDSNKKFLKYTPEQIQVLIEKSDKIDTILSKIQETYESVTQKNQKISALQSVIFEYSEKAAALYTAIETSYKNVEDVLQRANNFSTEAIGLLEESKQTRASLDTMIAEIKAKSQTLQDVEVLLTNSSEIKDKIDLTHSNINKSFADISSLHKRIYGFTDEDEEGKEIKITGLKDDLEKSYKDLAEELTTLHKEIDSSLNSSFLCKTVKA